MKTPFATIIPPKHNYIKSVRSQNPLQQDLCKNTHKSTPDTHTQNPTTQTDPKHPTTPPAKTAKPEYIAMQQESQKEQRVLKVSMFSALMLAILGVGFGVWIQSKAVIFDGFVALVSVGLGALSVITSRYIYKEDDDVFQYGYVRFEPMVNFFKSLIMVLTCAYAFINALESIFSGGYDVLLDGAVVYALGAFIFCAILYGYTRIYANSLDSDLIRVDNTDWKIDCVLYLGVLITFALLYVLLESSPLDSVLAWLGVPDSYNALELSTIALIARYVDPVLLATLSLLLCITPVRICVENFKDLLMVAPKEIDEKLTAIMENLSMRYGFSDYDTHTAKSGRFYMIEVNILLDGTLDSARTTRIGSINDVDKIRDEIEQALQIPSYKIWLSVSFTANPKWL
ncbi:cation diffusion facilitator family transporter [Helicobacter sp.]|uniref:cation diffusion facilitator family transporter n=1 Tax=Helicobacter sp. TaxID=218 RepID=UPI00388DE1CE